MANRHKQFAKGGGVAPKHDAHKKAYNAADANVTHEAESTENKKSGGRIKRTTGGRVPGFKSGGRLDRRARGGGVGADKSPFSSAHIKGHAAGTNPHPHHGGHAHGYHGAGMHGAHKKG